ncbi:MAG: S-adenosylmethionine transporter [Sclerophora amabilis]|nr:MAG: S-adenosylmethionine transporter [Sclerophora amabilis]
MASATSPPNPLLKNPYTSSLLAGALAGTTVDLSLYPIDTLKTRLQSSTGFGSSGGFNGIYKGVGSALVGSAPGAALFFVSYESVKKQLREARLARERLLAIGAGPEGGGATSVAWSWAGSLVWSEPVEHMLAASIGEVAACAVRVPTEVIKQRAQASQHPSSWAAFASIWALRKRSRGLVGVWGEMYRGWGITVMREVPFTVIQFPLWEGMKEWRRRTSGREKVSAAESGIFGSIAGAVAAGVTTPLDVLKTRMMLAAEKQHTIPLLRQIVKESGRRAFFAGMGPRVLWISAGGAVFLGSYQWAYNELAGLE